MSLFSAKNDEKNAPSKKGRRQTFDLKPRGRFQITAHADGSYPVGKLSVPVRDSGAGGSHAELTLACSGRQRVPPLEDPRAWRLDDGGNCPGGFPHATKRDTGRAYAVARVQLQASAPAPTSAARLDSIFHPFITPLKFAFLESTVGPGLVSLLSPLAGGGHLIHRLQRERRFDEAKARRYTAELVLALGYLHTKHITFALLDPAHVLLDAYGHVSLCNPVVYSHLGLPISGHGDSVISPCSPGYAAPEVLLRQNPTSAVDWWMMGALLYEMTVGRPPFYHKDAGEQERRITHQPVEFPSGMPPATTDLLAAFLAKDPSRRLGANGAAAVKEHPFFHGVAWQELVPRKEAGPLYLILTTPAAVSSG